jgi:RHS repeat-associated protein
LTPRLSHRKNATDRFYHSGWLGSTRYLSDSTGNSFPNGMRYDGYGRKVSQTGGDWHPSQFLFAGGWGYQTEYSDDWQGTIGLQYLEQRYLDSETGRFVSADPIGFAGGLNLYGYVGNNPVGGVDPDGLYPTGIYYGEAGEALFGQQAASGLASSAALGALATNLWDGYHAWGEANGRRRPWLRKIDEATSAVTEHWAVATVLSMYAPGAGTVGRAAPFLRYSRSTRCGLRRPGWCTARGLCTATGSNTYSHI